MLHARDGPFFRPHPAFWWIVLGMNLLYELGTVFLLFQDRSSARSMMMILDPSLNKPLAEKNYGENCRLTATNLWNVIDIFCLAHTLGWFGKALILRDYWFCWILSVAFELAEYSLQHQLAYFNECWWDHWVLDVLICNWIGTYLGMKTCSYFEVKGYIWRGFRRTRGIRSEGMHVPTQFSPQDWTTFKWEETASLRNYVAVLALLAFFLAAELTPFYLKTLLWMKPTHPFVIARLIGVFLCALPAVRELYQYVNDPRRAVRMGQHAWLLAATICTELLCIVKWSKGLFPEPFPTHTRFFLGIGFALLVVYPLIQFGVPKARRNLRRRTRAQKAKQQ